MIIADDKLIFCPICGVELLENTSFTHEFGKEDSVSRITCNCHTDEYEIYANSIEYLGSVDNLRIYESDIDQIYFIAKDSTKDLEVKYFGYELNIIDLIKFVRK